MTPKTFAIQTMLMREHGIIAKAIQEVGGSAVLQDVFEIPVDKEADFRAAVAAGYKALYGN